MESDLVARYQNQLTRLEQTSPLYWYRYGEGLRNSLLMLYPDSLAVKALDKQWQAELGGLQGDVISVPTYPMPAPGWMPCSISCWSWSASARR